MPSPAPKDDIAPKAKNKDQEKTVQEIDREKLDKKFSKDKKETLN